MGKNYRLERTELGDKWDAFVTSSPDLSVFITSAYLDNVGARIGLYKCLNVEELRAVVAVVESADGSAAVLDDLVIYSGICVGPPTTGQTRAQRISERYELATFVAEQLANRYESIEFAMPPSMDDVRPFLWHNYGREFGRYSANVRYTSYLSIADMAGAERLESIDAYREATGARRREIRYARRDGVVTEEFREVSVFADFYRRTMERQGESVVPGMLDRMTGLIDALISGGVAKMFATRTADGALGNVAVYAVDPLRAYYLFGAGDPALRNTPTGTAILWDAFSALAKDGVTLVDLEGVNSPRRGWFKMSFGGTLVPYYEICMRAGAT